jgi:hypothetical protein
MLGAIFVVSATTLPKSLGSNLADCKNGAPELGAILKLSILSFLFADNSEVFIGASRRNGKNQLDR